MMKMNVPLQLKKLWNLCHYLKDISIIINKMNNYYGDITIDRETIHYDIFRRFNTYSENYINDIIVFLYEHKILGNRYSVSGWNIFHGEIIYDYMRRYIVRDCEMNRKKLKFMWCIINRPDIPYTPEIFKKIGSYMKLQP